MPLMRRFLMSVAMMAAGVALAATADAGQRADGPKSSSFSHTNRRPYHEVHGTRFSSGYFYRGHEHRHWTYRYWSGRYGCYTYWCPSTFCWYYWYPQHERFYPVSYITTATPVARPAPVAVETGVRQIVNVTNNSPGSATAGAGAAGTPLPPAPVLPAPVVPAPVAAAPVAPAPVALAAPGA
jgi:hypothetical protein